MKRILFINAWEEYDKAMAHIHQGGDQIPLHHFWGYDAFQNREDFQISLFEYNKNSWLNKLGTKLRIQNLQQQIDCLRRQNDFDAFFVPFMEHASFLAILRKLGIVNKPIFGIAQGAYVINEGDFLKKLKGYISRFIYFKGFDYVLFMNQNLLEESAKYLVKGKADCFEHWGVDVDFFDAYIHKQTALPTRDYILFSGGTGRDFKTLLHAFDGLDFKLRVIPKKKKEYPPDAKALPNVEVDYTSPNGLLSTGSLRKEYYNALAVAIPLEKLPWFSPFGSTVLFEAMAMGKPVITTINKAFPIDVEKEKIGFTIDYGDVKGWQEAILYLKNHPDEARAMGERGRCLCQKKFNYKLFSQEVVEQFTKEFLISSRVV